MVWWGARCDRGVTVRCDRSAHVVTAHADVRLPSWLALVPDWSFAIVGTAVKEEVP